MSVSLIDDFIIWIFSNSTQSTRCKHCAEVLITQFVRCKGSCNIRLSDRVKMANWTLLMNGFQVDRRIRYAAQCVLLWRRDTRNKLLEALANVRCLNGGPKSIILVSRTSLIVVKSIMGTMWPIRDVTFCTLTLFIDTQHWYIMLQTMLLCFAINAYEALHLWIILIYPV